ncbi:DUF3429 domain-containing protein [Methylocystis echinoides]|uniref:DUF3429 domain-containing protein n=1 Tax=Methylocystis echinoides TaxID=29468 RepID=UPI003447BB06
MRTRESLPEAAKWLGYAGAIPFFAGALASIPFFAGTLRPFGLTLLLGYGAIILSFMGGVHWGAAMQRDDPGPGPLGRSVAPSLLALPALLIGGVSGLILLAAGFMGLLFYDLAETRAGRAPQWYPKLRRPLTAIVVSCLVVGAAAQSF